MLNQTNKLAIIGVSAFYSILLMSSLLVLLAYFGISFSNTVLSTALFCFFIVLFLFSIAQNISSTPIKQTYYLKQFPSLLALIVIACLLPAFAVHSRTNGELVSTIAILIIASFNYLFAIFLTAIVRTSNPIKSRDLVVYAYKYLFIANTIVSLYQYLGFETGRLDKLFFTNNEELAAIILPSYGALVERLRVPGLFWNGGTNATFYTIGFLYLWSKALTRSKLKLIECGSLALSTFMIYQTFTRRVWLSLIITLILTLLTSTALKIKKKYGVIWALILLISAVSLLPVVLLYIYQSSAASLQIFNSLSLLDRLLSWRYYFEDLIFNASIFEIFFGTGVLQETFHLYLTYFPYIDLLWLSVLVYGGFFLLVSFFMLYAYMFTNTFKALTQISDRDGKHSAQFVYSVLIFSFFVSLFQTFWSTFHGMGIVLAIYIFFLGSSKPHRNYGIV